MKCKQAQLDIDDYVDGYLQGLNREALEHHLGMCTLCEHRFEARRAMVENLKQLPALTGPSPALLQQVLQSRRRLESDTKSQRKKWFTIGATSSLAASVLIGFSVSMFIGKYPADTAPSAPIVKDVAGISKHQVITVLFNSKTALGDVKFSVIPPRSVEIEGFVGEREVAWSGKLRKGENLLKIPLILNGYSTNVPSELRVSIEHNREVRQFSVTLDAAKLRPAAT